MQRNPFNIYEIRSLIFGYVYPAKVKKGMVIQIVKSRMHPFLTGRISMIDEISRFRKQIAVVLVNEQSNPEKPWYKTITYLYPNHGDELKVVLYT